MDYNWESPEIPSEQCLSIYLAYVSSQQLRALIVSENFRCFSRCRRHRSSLLLLNSHPIHPWSIGVDWLTEVDQFRKTKFLLYHSIWLLFILSLVEADIERINSAVCNAFDSQVPQTLEHLSSESCHFTLRKRSHIEQVAQGPTKA